VSHPQPRDRGQVRDRHHSPEALNEGLEPVRIRGIRQGKGGRLRTAGRRQGTGTGAPLLLLQRVSSGRLGPHCSLAWLLLHLVINEPLPDVPDLNVASGLLTSWNLDGLGRFKNQAQIGSWIDGFCGGQFGAQMLQHPVVDRTA